MKFYLGTHMINHAGEFDYSFISANRLWNRKSLFAANNWIMDSGAFSEISNHGHFRHTVEEYAALINKFKDCGNLECAVTQDMMCEPFIVEKTGLSVLKHQKITIERYNYLVALCPDVYIMPVLQGYTIDEYLRHMDMYGALLMRGMRVGVGSVCKRNANPGIVEGILSAVKMRRPDLKLHGFGLKRTALKSDLISSLLFSADSMSWSYHARKTGGNSSGLKEAKAFKRSIETMPIQGNIFAKRIENECGGLF